MLTSLMNATNRTQRIVALMFAVVMIAGLAGVIQMAVTSLYSGYTAIDEKRALLGKLKAIATAGVSFQAQLLPENDGNPMLLSGENEAVMSAALQSWLQDVVGTAGGQINSVNNVSETGENGFRMIGLKANLSGSMEVVHRTIASIENNQPRLFIKEVVLNSTYQQTSAEETLPAELTATIVFLGASGAPGKSL
jgi:hypothetical protein